MTEISIHNVKDIVGYKQTYDSKVGDFTILKLFATDKNGVETQINLFLEDAKIDIDMMKKVK